MTTTCPFHGDNSPLDVTGAHCQACVALGSDLMTSFAARHAAILARLDELRTEIAHLARERDVIAKAAFLLAPPRGTAP